MASISQDFLMPDPPGLMERPVGEGFPAICSSEAQASGRRGPPALTQQCRESQPGASSPGEPATPSTRRLAASLLFSLKRTFY